MEDSIYSEIHLNSQYRTTGTLSQPSWIISPALYCDFAKVKTCELPVTWYSVNTTNNTIVFYESDTPETARIVHIPVGNYNPSTLEVAIKTAMDTAGTQVYTVSVSLPSRVLSMNGADKDFKLDFTAGSTAKLLGFNDGQTAESQTIVGDRSINLNSVEAIYLVSNSIKSNTISPGYPGSILCKIPLRVNSGELNLYDSSSCSFDIFPVSQHINLIDVQLIDCDSLLPLDLNGSSFSLTLSCWS